MKEKIVRVKDPHQVLYSKEQKEILKTKRTRAIEIR
jgi:hypothetical protein